MSNVYFKKVENLESPELINDICYKMLNKIVSEEKIELKGTIPLKVHFGEKGNDTFIKPNYFDGIKKYLKENNLESCYIDTNVLYKGSRTVTKDHLETARKHGFTDLEIVIADGDNNNPYEEIEINKKHYKNCKIGTRYSDYKNYIIIAHFKGHGLAGMGASIKQLAMGFASRAGKLEQHSTSIPIIDKEKCIKCGKCVRICPVNAISMPDKAQINPKICIGCASCIAVCPVSAISNTWQNKDFYENLAEYAFAAQKGKTNIYFNLAFNITKGCDCEGHHMEKIADDIGIFVSTDPVAIDTATLEMFEKLNDDRFNKSYETLKYAEKIGLGTKKYNFIEL